MVKNILHKCHLTGKIITVISSKIWKRDCRRPKEKSFRKCWKPPKWTKKKLETCSQEQFSFLMIRFSFGIFPSQSNCESLNYPMIRYFHYYEIVPWNSSYHRIIKRFTGPKSSMIFSSKNCLTFWGKLGAMTLILKYNNYYCNKWAYNTRPK